MKESMWGYWIIVLGISIVSVMILLQNYSTTDEQTFFLVKESLQNAMKEAVDYAYIEDSGKAIDVNTGTRDYGRIKINKEKFVENFIRRFSDSVDISKTYEINFYYISEMPPAASVSVTAKTGSTNFGKSQTAADEQVEATSRLTGILFTTGSYNPSAGFRTSSGGGDICSNFAQVYGFR